MSRTDERIRVFLDEIEAVCRKHNLCITHDFPQGGFIIEPFSEENLIELRDESSVRLEE